MGKLLIFLSQICTKRVWHASENLVPPGAKLGAAWQAQQPPLEQLLTHQVKREFLDIQLPTEVSLDFSVSTSLSELLVSPVFEFSTVTSLLELFVSPVCA